MHVCVSFSISMCQCIETVKNNYNIWLGWTSNMFQVNIPLYTVHDNMYSLSEHFFLCNLRIITRTKPWEVTQIHVVFVSDLDCIKNQDRGNIKGSISLGVHSWKGLEFMTITAGSMSAVRQAQSWSSGWEFTFFPQTCGRES